MLGWMFDFMALCIKIGHERGPHIGVAHPIQRATVREVPEYRLWKRWRKEEMAQRDGAREERGQAPRTTFERGGLRPPRTFKSLHRSKSAYVERQCAATSVHWNSR